MGKKFLYKIMIANAIIFMIIDTLYRTVNSINYLSREQCFLYTNIPRVQFLFFEYFVESTIILLVGVFFAVVLGNYFAKYEKFYPKGQVTAFIYASILPLCSCTAIPLVETMKNKMSMRTLVTFLVAAPVLNPYIIILSFSVLGVEYGTLRVLFAFVLAVSSGIAVDLLKTKRWKIPKSGETVISSTGSGNRTLALHPLNARPALNTRTEPGLASGKKDTYEKTIEIFVAVLPYLLIGGVMGILYELYAPDLISLSALLSDKLGSILIALGLGTPAYLCNGADVFVLRPLMERGSFPLGSALVFSVSSTAICLTSFFMLLKVLGKKETSVLLANIVFMLFLMGVFLNFAP